MTQSDPGTVPDENKTGWSAHWAAGGLVVGCVATLLWFGALMTLGGWAVGIIEF